MTDLECLKQIIKSLDLKEGVASSVSPHDDGFITEDSGNSITIGSGEGYVDFIAKFSFNESGKCISHGVWE